jgi:hypothetical protein
VTTIVLVSVGMPLTACIQKLPLWKYQLLLTSHFLLDIIQSIYSLQFTKSSPLPPCRLYCVSLTVAVTLAILSVTAPNNGAGKLPAIGFDTFNAFSCEYNSSNILAQANAIRNV